MGQLYVIGLGPGEHDLLTVEAQKALNKCEVVLGYKTYVKLAGDLLKGKEIMASGMTKELDRAALALEQAAKGRKVGLISSGDPGIYGMSPVVFEAARAKDLRLDGSGGFKVRIICGVTALSAAGACLGAPLSHDFACISLSDRMTPWELIEKRLDLAAQADLVIVLFNPKSKGRPWQFERACSIVARHRGEKGVVGIVNRAAREGQAIELTTLAEAFKYQVDMQTLVIIGNSQSFVYQGSMVTPRGYVNKYGEAWGGEKAHAAKD
jgi:precorrin-3B C17-methyltransferase